jgi:type IX secretion system PorP/SprF family membrane protein
METLKKLLLLMFLVSGMNLNAQDPHFSQYFSNPLVLNPAFAGSAGCSRASIIYRNQWPNIPGNFVSIAASYDQYSNTLKGGIGFNYEYDVAGNSLFSHFANACYAYPIKLSENLIVKPAVHFGIGKKSIDGSQFTPPLVFSNDKLLYFNAGAGVIAVYKNLIGGFAIDHLNKPNIGFESKSKLPMRFAAHLSDQFILSEKIFFTPVILFEKQQQFKELVPFVLFNISAIKFGVGFRTGFDNPDSFISMIGYQNSRISVGYSYDVTISRLANATGGSHEISLVYKFNCKNKTDKFFIPRVNNF